jgi:hypothetical protein
MPLSTADVLKIGKEILNDFIVLIVEMDVDKSDFEDLYSKCYALSSRTYYAPAHEDGLKMLQRLLLFATRLLAIENEGDASRSIAQEAFTMLKSLTMHYHRLYTSDRYLFRRADIHFKTVHELAEVEFEKHYSSLRMQTMRACKSKLLEMAERAKFAARARPGGEDFAAVQQDNVSNGRMMM